jgi:5-methylcytosine-specific restriction endonuclease McrA
MLTCRVCLRRYKEVRFRSERICICGRCVNTLNENAEVAELAQKRLGELLLRGMERNAHRDLTSEEQWKRKKAANTLANIGAAHAEALPTWLNRLVADPKNTSRDFKVVRAYRRGLLHFDRPAGWGYPKNWKEVASRIRQLDNFACIVCAAQDRTIDVHHIVYVSNYGTHQQSNLISLCRQCHEAEHKRIFDFGEAEDDNIPVEEEPPVQALSTPLPKTVPAGQQSPVKPEPYTYRPPQLVPPPPPPPPIPMQATASASSLATQSPISQLQPHKDSSAPRLQKLGPPLLSPNYPSTAQRVTNQQERFCGQCRILVTPRKRFLWFRQCPLCRRFN